MPAAPQTPSLPQPRTEFAKRVKALRKRHKLTRIELAGKTGIPFKTIGDIERGEKVVLDAQLIVSPLADCFDLHAVTREEFFAAAGLLLDTLADQSSEQAPTWNRLHTLFYRSTNLPAVIVDPFYTIHSSNAYFNALFGIDPLRLSQRLFEGAGPNMLRLLLDPTLGVRERFGARSEWLSLLRGNLFSLRLNIASRVGTPAYEQLIRALSEFPEFAAVWAEVSAPDYTPRLAGIPTIFKPGSADEMQFVVALVFPPRFGQLEERRMLYIPADLETERRFEILRLQIRPVVYQYAASYPSCYRIVREIQAHTA